MTGMINLVGRLNVKNIPAIISALHSVFQSQLDNALAFKENGDRIRISMPFNYDRGDFDSIKVIDTSQRIVTNIPNKIEFKFEKPIHVNDPLTRIPTLYDLVYRYAQANP